MRHNNPLRPLHEGLVPRNCSAYDLTLQTFLCEVSVELKGIKRVDLLYIELKLKLNHVRCLQNEFLSDYES